MAHRGLTRKDDTRLAPGKIATLASGPFRPHPGHPGGRGGQFHSPQSPAWAPLSGSFHCRTRAGRGGRGGAPSWGLHLLESGRVERGRQESPVCSAGGEDDGLGSRPRVKCGTSVSLLSPHSSPMKPRLLGPLIPSRKPRPREVTCPARVPQLGSGAAARPADPSKGSQLQCPLWPSG